MKPIVWTIAGSDSGGGAGIQADLKTMELLGVHGCSAITAVTAQSPRQVTAVEYLPSNFLSAQLETMWPDLPPRAVKTGMIGDEASIETVMAFLSTNKVPYFVCDPVLVATSGALLAKAKSLDALKRLIEISDLVTPNLPESEALGDLSAKSLLLKGGHSTDEVCADFYSGQEKFWLISPRQNVSTHGTGCTLSAAIASYVALGFSEKDALVGAKLFLNRKLREGRDYCPDDLPMLSSERTPPSFTFKKCEPIGFYPIVPRAKLVERLVKVGVKSIQLRIKDLNGEALEREIAEASRLAREFRAQLFINDFWDLALKHNAFGVHLGQEDTGTADFGKLSRAGVALGISTHSFSELARAKTFSPSYYALGPIFPTTTKVMKFSPQGFKTLALWRKLISSQLVAIGGIQLEHATRLYGAGADGISVVRDIVNADDVEAKAKQWLYP